MVDIHAEHASPAGRAGQQGHLRTLRRNDRAPFRLDGAPGAQFHVAEGITPELWRLAVIVGKGRGHGGGTCAEKRIDARGCEQFPERHRRTAPSGGGEERRIHARLLRHFLEPEQMPFVFRCRKMAMAVASPGERVFPDHRSAPEFVLRLNRNDRAAVLKHQSFELLPELSVVALDVGEIRGVIAPLQTGHAKEPLGHSAGQHLRVHKGSRPQPDIHAVLGAELDELPDVAVAGEIELPGLLFQMAPDDVERDGVEAAGFHLEDGFLPRFLVRPRGVHFARDRHEWFPADFKTLAGHDELGPLRVDPAPGVGADGLDRPGLLCVERVEQLSRRRSGHAFGAFGAHRDVVQARGRSFGGPELNSDVCARRDFGSNQHRPISWNEFFHRKRSVVRPKNSDTKDSIRPPHLQNIAF